MRAGTKGQGLGGKSSDDGRVEPHPHSAVWKPEVGTLFELENLLSHHVSVLPQANGARFRAAESYCFGLDSGELQGALDVNTKKPRLYT